MVDRPATLERMPRLGGMAIVDRSAMLERMPRLGGTAIVDRSAMLERMPRLGGTPMRMPIAARRLRAIATTTAALPARSA